MQVRRMLVRHAPLRRCSSAVILILTGLTLALSLPSRAEKVEDLPKPTNYVSDFAHVLSPDTEQRLDHLCSQLDHSGTNTQVAIVTIRTLDGDDASNFANRLEEKWKVGKKGSDRGILMLFAIADHKRWIEVGYGLEGILPDAKVGDIGRAMVPQLRASDYNGALTRGLVEIAKVVSTDAHATLDDPTLQAAVAAPSSGDPSLQDPSLRNLPGDAGPDSARPRRPQQRHTSTAAIIFRIVLVVLVLVFFGFRGLFGFGLGMLMGGGGRRGGWGGGGGFGGGGGGGGDSGGGFGGFGGGESGGGGAGGDW